MWFLRGIGQRDDRGAREARATPEIYEEAAFRHFLGLERRRAERRGRSLLLLLVDLSGAPAGRDARMTMAAIAFEVLETSVRESDFVGWYEASRVAGAVLVQGDIAPTPVMCTDIGRRTAALLKQRLPAVTAEVKVLQLEATREKRHA